MKKTIFLFATFLLFTTNIYSTNKKSLKELEKQEIAEKGYQTVNKLKSTYKEKKWDGYSWRYRENKYDKNDKKMSKKNYYLQHGFYQLIMKIMFLIFS